MLTREKIKMNNDKINNLINNKTLIKSKITSVVYSKELQTQCLCATVDNKDILIPAAEVDIEKKWSNLDGFVGRELSFVLIDANNKIIGSRKRLQETKRPEVIQALKNNEVLQGTIVNILKYGAYVEIDGVLTALIKNNDFANDFTSISEVYKRDQKIDVQLKNANNEFKIIVKAVKKFTADTKKFFDKNNTGDIVEGRIKTLLPDKCFVNLYPGVDGLCKVPFDLIVDEKVKVLFEIKKIDKENKRVKGKIIDVLL